ncbi:MAG: gluconate 5-dehydrogenase [Armatimonadetes bacterium 13_1_40CM_64_14]|jgi:gluconate 5-dehydrogenase|nr:MAG: gluconate 5-dehydrogenase [Armatimonadetes bacterium 13_1_40CM_64_14]
MSETRSVQAQFDLRGRVAIVTGGSRGLGLEIARSLGEVGARVVIAARRPQWLQTAEQTLRSAGIEVLARPCNVVDPAEVDALTQAALGWGGRVDILVTSAGISWGAPSLEMPPEKFREVLDVNVTGTFLAAQAAARVMRPVGYGKMIFLTSAIAFQGQPAEVLDAVGYAASKGAVVSLVRDLAVKWGPWGIRVNALAPGYFSTRLSQGIIARSEAEIVRRTPLGRVGQPEDLKGAALFLAAPASDYVTGQVLVVDGGMTV